MKIDTTCWLARALACLNGYSGVQSDLKKRRLEGLPDATRRPSRHWEDVYREAGYSAAQQVRHADLSKTSEMYSHIEASELSEIGSWVFKDER
jgi:hypothetical protein